MARRQSLSDSFKDAYRKQIERFSSKPKPGFQGATAENNCMFQAFEWNVPADQNHWIRLVNALESLKAIGINNVWIPPACKGANPRGNGYDVYDLYDLGEFDQKGERSTKFGPKEDLMNLASKAKEIGVGLYFDAVLNHRAGADQTQNCRAVEVDGNDRTIEISDPCDIEAWLGFDFPGRGNRYSSQKYNWNHFSGTDFNVASNKKAIYKIIGEDKDWSRSVDMELGNYDYLMFADVDYSQTEVREDIKNWGVWISTELSLKGFRVDAIRHFSQSFMKEFVSHLEDKIGAGQFFVGEFWKDSLNPMLRYLENLQYKISLFDVPLVYNFSKMSKIGSADLRRVFDGTLVKARPANAVTFVMNHDTQPGQASEAPIADFFKSLAYSLILLRIHGYPCVFYGDLYGMRGDDRHEPEGPSCGGKLPDLCLARKFYAYGKQNDYFDAPHCIGWTREGTLNKPFGLACVISNGRSTEKKMYVGHEHAGEVWTDIMGSEKKEVMIGRNGKGTFPCGGLSIAVFANREAEGQDRFGKFDGEIYK